MSNLQEKQNPHVEKGIFHITVNSRPKVVNQEVLTFEQIADLAFPTPDGIQNPIYTVTFKNADQNPSAGTLVAGESIKIKNGTIFNVTRTGQS